MNPGIDIRDYTYELPEDRIALHPGAQRDQSQLLVYSQGSIHHKIFSDLPDLLPPGSIVFFNDTRVIPARIFFQKDTGAVIETFLLQPTVPAEIQQAMQATRSVIWKCAIGNAKRWPDHTTLVKTINQIELNAELLDRQAGVVKFSWTPSEVSFAEVIAQSGVTPLPPYIKRAAAPADKESYQTVYSHFHGAVAAPTAGLHFTEQVLSKLRAKNIALDFLTLHVSAGTFQPVKTPNAWEHPMHSEQVVISKENIVNALSHDRVIAVGTTSMRTLESIYWYGVKLLKDRNAVFRIEKMDPYASGQRLPSKEDALHAVLHKIIEEQKDTLTGETAIYIVPGYSFKICNALITNFHQPGSTLMLLVAAFVGDDWKRIYQEALANGYRFLSYGDSSLLMPEKMWGSRPG